MSRSSDGRTATASVDSEAVVRNANSALDHFLGVARDLGFEFRIYALSSGRTFLPFPWSHLPEGLTAENFNTNLLSPILDVAVRRRGLCDWRNLRVAESRADSFKSMPLSTKFEINAGYSASFVGVGLRCDVVIVLSSQGNMLNDKDRLALFEAMSRMWHAQHEAEWELSLQHQKLPKLTQREMQVLVWIKEGKSYGDVATITGLSTRAIEFHAKNVLLKLEAANKLSAVLNAIKLGILPIE